MAPKGGGFFIAKLKKAASRGGQHKVKVEVENGRKRKKEKEETENEKWPHRQNVKTWRLFYFSLDGCSSDGTDAFGLHA